MKILKWILTALAVAATGLMVFLWYMDMFSKPVISERVIGPYTIAYEDYMGPYKNTGKVFETVYNNLMADGIETTKGLGIYYDDPQKVPAEKLRSRCGSVVEENDIPKLMLMEKKYNIATINQAQSVVIEFPIKNNLSYMMGPMKNYPVLTKYAKAREYQLNSLAYELYDIPNKKIYFIMEIKKENLED
ncbi:hypothetical protein ACFL58_01675 [Elusimicrobiota bacterium]